MNTFTLKDGRSVYLRTPQSDDAMILADFLNELVDEDVMIAANVKHVTLEEEEKYLSKLLREISNKQAVYLYAFDVQSDKFLGACNITKKEFRKQHVGEMGISLRKTARGAGLGTILMEQTTALAQKELGISQLNLTCFADNKAAQALYQKMGFIQHGYLPRAINYRGKLVDEVQMYKELDS